MAPRLEHRILTTESPATKRELYYHAACNYANIGQSSKAFELLEKAVWYGWKKNDAKDLCFDSLKTHHGWSRLLDISEETERSGRENFVWGIYFGILFILFFYHLFLFIGLKDVSFLYYALLLFAFSQLEVLRTDAFARLTADLFTWQHLFTRSGQAFYAVVSLCMFLQILFARAFLSLKINHPKLNRIMTIALAYFLLCFALALLGLPSRISVSVGTGAGMLLIFGAAVFCWRRGFRSAWFYVLASVCSTAGVIIRILNSLDVTRLNLDIAEFGPDTAGFIVFFALLSFALSDRINILKKEKETAQEKAMAELETRVKERTIEVVKQKHIIEEKHKEITDSINYAERIQRSFIATDTLLANNLKNYFVIFKPKDVVSGDFYWGGTLANGTFALVTGDSTGHGVPGAIMSLLNITSIEKAVERETDPAQILNQTRHTIIERLKKDGSAEGGKDGMDCSLLCFDFHNMLLKIAAANLPVLVVRNVVNGNETGKELFEIKPDKMPVGKHDKDHQSFLTKTFQLQPNDMLYTFTDGFPDQFGEKTGKKFMVKKLKELLVSHSHLPVEEQKKVFSETFKIWTGELEQTDDVTLIGIRV